MIDKKILDQQKFKLGEMDIDLNPNCLKFNENTLSQYYQDEGGYYDYFSAQLAYADYLLSKRELEYDKVYNERFTYNKDLGGSDKYVEAKTKADEEVINAKDAVILAKYKKNLLQQHIRAWDRNHDNALNLGHMLRKEMEKLGLELKQSSTCYDNEFSNFAEEIDIEELKKDD